MLVVDDRDDVARRAFESPFRCFTLFTLVFRSELLVRPVLQEPIRQELEDGRDVVLSPEAEAGRLPGEEAVEGPVFIGPGYDFGASSVGEVYLGRVSNQFLSKH